MSKYFRKWSILLLFLLAACSGGASGAEPIGEVSIAEDEEAMFFDFTVGTASKRTCESFVLTYEDSDDEFKYEKRYTNVETASVTVAYTLSNDEIYNKSYHLWDSDMYEILPHDELSKKGDDHFQDLAFLPFLSFGYDNNAETASISESVYRAIDKQFYMGNLGDVYMYSWNFSDGSVYYVYDLATVDSCSVIFPIELEVETVDLDYQSEGVVTFNDGANKFELELPRETLIQMVASESNWINADPAEIQEFDGTFSFEYGTANSNSFIRFLQKLPATIYYQTDGSSSTFGKIVFDK